MGNKVNRFRIEDHEGGRVVRTQYRHTPAPLYVVRKWYPLTSEITPIQAHECGCLEDIHITHPERDDSK